MVSKFIKRGTNKENVWEHGSVGQLWKGTRTSPGRPSLRALLICQKRLEGSVRLKIQRGYYTVARRYEFIIEWQDIPLRTSAANE